MENTVLIRGISKIASNHAIKMCTKKKTNTIVEPF